MRDRFCASGHCPSRWMRLLPSARSFYTAPVRALLRRAAPKQNVHDEIVIPFGISADRFSIRHCIIHVSRVSTPPLQTHCLSNHERAECSFKGAILLHSHARRSFRNHSHCPSIDGVLFITLHCNIHEAVVWLGYTAPVRALLP